MTCLPLGSRNKFTPGEFSRAMSFFPLVGLAMAVFPAIFILIVYPFLSPLAGALTIVLIFVLITRGLHLDGLADTVDGLSGGKDKKEVLVIMRDSRIGSMGVIALILVIFFKAVLLNEIWAGTDKFNLLKAIFLFPVMGRWSMVSAAWLLPYARKEEGISTGWLGLGEVFTKGITIREWLLSTFFTGFIAVLALNFYAFLFLPLVFLTTLVFIKYFKRRVGGVTGDVFGAINELIEVAALGYMLLFFHLQLMTYNL